jgi:hypothetical protein
MIEVLSQVSSVITISSHDGGDANRAPELVHCLVQKHVPLIPAQKAANFSVSRIAIKLPPHHEEAAKPPSRRMAASIALPALVLRDAILRIAPQDEGSENRRTGLMSIQSDRNML